jgi:transcriptional regulator with XRE-family HTH domain
LTRQEEIKYLLHTFGIKQSWLAEKLGLNNQTLTYLLNDAPLIDEDLYNKVKDILDDYQFDLALFDEDEPKDTLDLFEEGKLQEIMGERIRIFAKRKYGTLKKLAEEMRISPQQLQQYISGKREPGSKILAKLLRLGCDINWLLGGIESMEAYRTYLLEAELRKLQTGIDQIAHIVKGLRGSK